MMTRGTGRDRINHKGTVIDVKGLRNGEYYIGVQAASMRRIVNGAVQLLLDKAVCRQNYQYCSRRSDRRS